MNSQGYKKPTMVQEKFADVSQKKNPGAIVGSAIIGAGVVALAVGAQARVHNVETQAGSSAHQDNRHMRSLDRQAQNWRKARRKLAVKRALAGIQTAVACCPRRTGKTDWIR